VLGHLSARDSMKGTLGRVPLLGNLKNEVFERYEMPCKQASLSTGALLENQKGVHLLGLLREMKNIFGFFSWTQSSLRF